MPARSYEHVIIGGGILGAATAYHLRCRGAGPVLLLERNEFASAASSRAAGLILQAGAKPPKTALAKATREIVPVLEDLLGESIGFHPVGSVRVAASPERVADLRAIERDAAHQGIPVETVSPAEAAERVPWLDPAPISRAAFMPSDGYIDPYLLSRAFLKAAEARGATARARVAVTDILHHAGRVTGVATSMGPVACANVIDAAGAWAALVSAQAGYPLPLAPVRSHYWIAEPDKRYGREHPATVLPDIAAYARPEVGGLLFGLQEARSATFDARELPADPAAFSPTTGEEHWDILLASAAQVTRFFPAFLEAAFSSYICGLSSYTPDGEIVLGPVPGLEGFWAVAGACGHGIAMSSGMGALAADMVLGLPTFVDPAPFRPDRFGPVDPFSQAFRDRCAAARARKSRSDTRSAAPTR